MAAHQPDSGILFSIAHDLQQFRLLELPPEILELIDSPSPPPLSIKSQAASSASATPNPKPAYAVLCTPNRTFQLRQVQTSNSVFLTQAGPRAHGNEISALGIAAIASCTATLELHPTAESAVVYLKQALPVYDIVDGDVHVSGNGKSREDIFADIPLSNGECQKGWVELVAFVFSGSSFRPSANTLAQVWSAIHSAALVEGIKLDAQFLIRDMLKAVDEEAYPAELISAILRHLGADDQVEGEAWAYLEPRKTVIFVGRTLLEAKHGENYLTAEFLDTWKNAVPEAWREDAELNTIKGSYHLPSSTTIAFGGEANASGAGETAAPKISSSSRKWHEKFGRARKK